MSNMIEFHKINLTANDISDNPEKHDKVVLLNVLDHQLNKKSLEISLKQYHITENIIGDWNPTTVVRCGICWGNIKEGDATSECPYCSRKFHRIHWTEWLGKKSYCPTCRKSVRQERSTGFPT